MKSTVSHQQSRSVAQDWRWSEMTFLRNLWQGLSITFVSDWKHACSRLTDTLNIQCDWLYVNVPSNPNSFIENVTCYALDLTFLLQKFENLVDKKCYDALFTLKLNTKNGQHVYHSGNVSSSSVNGDIAIQWEWSNFDPSQNPNPLTNYDKTLHNWLRSRFEHVTPKFVPIGRKGASGEIREIWGLSLIFLFFPGLAYWSNPCMEFHARWLKTRVVTYKHVRASANGLKTNDVIEDWRHWLAVARRPSSVSQCEQ